MQIKLDDCTLDWFIGPNFIIYVESVTMGLPNRIGVYNGSGIKFPEVDAFDQ